VYHTVFKVLFFNKNYGKNNTLSHSFLLVFYFLNIYKEHAVIHSFADTARKKQAVSFSLLLN